MECKSHKRIPRTYMTILDTYKLILNRSMNMKMDIQMDIGMDIGMEMEMERLKGCRWWVNK